MFWYMIAAVLIALALLAYKWTYNIVGWDPATRRNLQWLLIIVLLLAAVLSVIFALQGVKL